MEKKNPLEEQAEEYFKQQIKSQEQIASKHAHVQTMLVFSQLHCAYYQTQLSLKKVFRTLNGNFQNIKINAFLEIQHVHRNICYNQSLYRLLQNASYKQKQIDLQDKEEEQIQLVARVRQKQYICNLQGLTQVDVQIKIQRLVQLLDSKIWVKISYSYEKMLMRVRDTEHKKIQSQHSSKNDTTATDSSKNRLFMRSKEYVARRKTASLQKSMTASLQKSMTASLQKSIKGQLPQRCQDSSSKYDKQRDLNRSGSGINKMMTKTEPRNLLLNSRQRASIKVSSTRKYITNQENKQRIEKIQELRVLRKKYIKLIAQFNLFSQRFVSAIEEEDM